MGEARREKRITIKHIKGFQGSNDLLYVYKVVFIDYLLNNLMSFTHTPDAKRFGTRKYDFMISNYESARIGI